MKTLPEILKYISEKIQENNFLFECVPEDFVEGRTDYSEVKELASNLYYALLETKRDLKEVMNTHEELVAELKNLHETLRKNPKPD